MSYFDKASQVVLDATAPVASLHRTPAEWAHSTVSAWGVRYSPPIDGLTIPESVEALVEGSQMSLLQPG